MNSTQIGGSVTLKQGNFEDEEGLFQRGDPHKRASSGHQSMTARGGGAENVSKE
jgi:hypothetical protein